MSHEEIKDKVLDWIAEEDLEILQDTKDEKTNFILTVKSKENTLLDFPINVISAKQKEGLVFGFTAKFLEGDHKSFLATDIEYRKKVVEEIGIGAAIANLGFVFQSNSKETKFNGTKMIFPDGLTKDRFFMVIDGLMGFYKYIIYVLKKYKFAPPKLDNFGI